MKLTTGQAILAIISTVAGTGFPQGNGKQGDVSSILASLSDAGALPSGSYADQWSSAFSSLQSAGKIPSTVTPPPANPTAYGPGQGPWGPHFSKGGGPVSGGKMGPPGGGPWGGPDGCGPWGSGSWGPFSHWSTDSSWRSNGPWTKWWGGDECPASDWPGWTEGPWSTNAPWTTWSGCTAKTTATSVVTMDASGSQVLSTAYGVQVAQAEAVTGSAAPTSVGSAGAGVPVRTAAPVLALGAAVMGVVGAL
jgi:hypothetical protein